MFDARLRPLIDPPLNRAGRIIAASGVSANGITVIGFGFGLSAAAFVAVEHTFAALVMIALNRLCDGLDGAVARATRTTKAGGFLDIVLDFFFYGAIPVAFAIADPARNGAAAAFLIASFYANGAAFLAFSGFADKLGLATDAQGVKSLYYMSGIAEGFETILVFVLFCLYASRFAEIAIVFGLVCFVSAAARCVNGYLIIRRLERRQAADAEAADDPLEDIFADGPQNR